MLRWGARDREWRGRGGGGAGSGGSGGGGGSGDGGCGGLSAALEGELAELRSSGVGGGRTVKIDVPPLLPHPLDFSVQAGDPAVAVSLQDSGYLAQLAHCLQKMFAYFSLAFSWSASGNYMSLMYVQSLYCMYKYSPFFSSSPWKAASLDLAASVSPKARRARKTVLSVTPGTDRPAPHVARLCPIDAAGASLPLNPPWGHSLGRQVLLSLRQAGRPSRPASGMAGRRRAGRPPPPVWQRWRPSGLPVLPLPRLPLAPLLAALPSLSPPGGGHRRRRGARAAAPPPPP